MTACGCRNHRGGRKQQHRTRDAALVWAIRSPRVRGMALTIYRCPRSACWHVTTRRRA